MNSNILRVSSLDLKISPYLAYPTVALDVNVEVNNLKTREERAAEAIFRAVLIQENKTRFLNNWFLSTQSLLSGEMIKFQGFFAESDDKERSEEYVVHLEKLNGFPVGKFYFTDALLKEPDPTFCNISISSKYCL